MFLRGWYLGTGSTLSYLLKSMPFQLVLRTSLNHGVRTYDAFPLLSLPCSSFLVVPLYLDEADGTVEQRRSTVCLEGTSLPQCSRGTLRSTGSC